MGERAAPLAPGWAFSVSFRDQQNRGLGPRRPAAAAARGAKCNHPPAVQVLGLTQNKVALSPACCARCSLTCDVKQQNQQKSVLDQ